MKIKNILLSISVLAVIALFMHGCDGMHDNYKEWVGERNYSGKIDSLTATPGFERVVLRWINPTDQKSKTIRVVYGPDSTVVDYPTLVNTASIEGLVNAVGVDFTVFTVDAFGNLSIPTKISAIPVTKSLMSSLTPPAVVVRSLGAEQLISFVGTSNVLMQFAGGIQFTLVNSDGKTVYEANTQMPEFVGANEINIPLTNLLPSGLYQMNYKMLVVPAMNNLPTEDQVWLESTAIINVLPFPDKFNLMNTIDSRVYESNGTSAPDSNEGILKLVDNSKDTKFLTSKNTVKIYWEMPRPFSITQYQITLANDANDRDPRDWTLAGSNDGGATWTTIDTQVDWKSNAADRPRFSVHLIDVPKTAPYKLYRWDITRNYGSSLIQIAEWVLWYDPTK